MHYTGVFLIVFMMSILKAQGFTQFMLKMRSVGLRSPVLSRIPGFGSSFRSPLSTQGYSTSSPALDSSNRVRISVRRNNVVSLKSKPYFLEQSRLREAARKHDYITGMQAYDNMTKMEDCTLSVDDLCVAISMCCKAEHIPKAMEIAESIRKNTTKPQEAMLLGLIRCYSDAYQLRIAMQIIKKVAPTDLRPRYFEPLLDAMKARGDFAAVLQLLQYMGSFHVPFREDQLLTLLQLCSTENGKQAIAADSVLRANVTSGLSVMSNQLIGMNTQFIKDTVMAFTNQTLPQIEDDGVLVGTLSDIPGTITGFNADGTVNAINTTFLTDRRHGLHANISALLSNGALLSNSAAVTNPLSSASTSSNNTHHTNATNTCNNTETNTNESDSTMEGSRWVSDGHCKLVPEKYKLVHPDSSTSVATTNETANNDATVNNSNSNTTPSNPIAALATPSPARIVDISHTNTCPNCAGKMASLHITDAERSATLQTLLKRVGSIESEYLEEFGVFLRENGPFDYVIDAANVAYQNQNFNEGRFNYEQLEWVYDELRKRTPRVLVVMSEIYARSSLGKVPNSAGSSRGQYHSSFTEPDLRFLNKLRDDKALYLCPRGADDDLFWLYSTLYERPEGYTSTSLVITNDLMRDHKANAFDSGRVFVRWRTQHIVNFMVNYDEVEPVSGEVKPKDRVAFYNSPPFSREIQPSSTEGFWHVPATDRNLWLCVQATPRAITPLNMQF